MNTSEKLDQLSDYQAQRDLIAIRKQELVDTIYTPEIKAKLAEIDTEFQTQYEGVDANIAKLTDEIKADVIKDGATVKGTNLMAVFSKGRVTWDGKKLDGMMSLIPQLKDARKEGEPSVSIRKV
jgi:hypothetical protein